MNNIRDEILGIIETEMQTHQKFSDIAGFDALARVAILIRRLGCQSCAWCKREFCTYHFPGEEIPHPTHICNDYMAKED